MDSSKTIYKALLSAPKNSEILISTWGISHFNYMKDIVLPLIQKGCKIKILVGYSKENKSLNILMDNIKSYLGTGIKFRVLPGFHAKIWLINNSVHVGSANFTPNTIHNLMIKTSSSLPKDFVQKYWKKGVDISKTTNLLLIKEK